jgi:hypothetical protein
MNRATAVLVDGNDHVSQSPASKHDQAQAAEITHIRRQLRDTDTSDNDSRTKLTPLPRSSRP